MQEIYYSNQIKFPALGHKMKEFIDFISHSAIVRSQLECLRAPADPNF